MCDRASGCRLTTSTGREVPASCKHYMQQGDYNLRSLLDVWI